jgi:hypothetical protein
MDIFELRAIRTSKFLRLWNKHVIGWQMYDERVEWWLEYHTLMGALNQNKTGPKARMSVQGLEP